MSLYDQYEQETYLKYSTMGIRTPVVQSNGIQDQMPIFKKQRIEFQPPDVITHMAVSNSNIVLALRTKKILKIDLNQKQTSNQPQTTEIEMSSYLGDRSQFAKLHKLFLSPTGKYSVLSFYYSDVSVASNCENFFIHNKVKYLTKFKGHLITAVGWNYQNETLQVNTTANILIGTSKGLVFETELISCDDSYKWLSSSPEQYCRVVFAAGDDAGEISDIEFHQTSEDKTYFILVTTKNRLYQFVGSVDCTETFSLANIFNNYQNNNQFQDMPGNLGFSKLDLYYPKNRPPPQTFGWLTEPGILYGKLDFTSLSSSSKVTSDAVLIPYTAEESVKIMHSSPPAEKPISMIITKFHILVLFKSFLRVICVINEKMVMEDVFTETYGTALGITKDVVKGTVWAYSELAVFRYKTNNEDRDIWKIYLDQGNFKLAKDYAKGDSQKITQVISEEADYHFNKKEYIKSAALYAKTTKSFEEIALKFLSLGNQDALKEFLIYKLDTYTHNDKTQVTLLVLWLLEMILNQMAMAKISGNTESEEYILERAKLQTVLNLPKVTAAIYENRKAVYDLVSSHGDEDALVCVATVLKDFTIVLENYMERQKWDEVLRILETQKNPSLIYKFAPLLIRERFKPLIKILKKLSSELDIKQLLPALVQHSNKDQRIEILSYLEHLVLAEKYEDTVVHNYLLALYAETSPKKLLTFIERNENSGEIQYDINYALRICTEIGLHKACVNLYTIMELYEEAVDLALTFDINLAKKTANKTQFDDDMRKKLWLKIAKDVVTTKKDINHVTELLKECHILRIEDVLPYFPDFNTISNFKFAICSSLEQYSKQMESLKDEMKEATEVAENIREEVKAVRNRFTVVKTNSKCDSCGYPLHTGNFYVFPCRHVFHVNCLFTGFAERMDSIQSFRKPVSPEKSSSLLERPFKLTKMLSSVERNEILASECLYCGETMIQTIDIPFLLPQENDFFAERL